MLFLCHKFVDSKGGEWGELFIFSHKASYVCVMVIMVCVVLLYSLGVARRRVLATRTLVLALAFALPFFSCFVLTQLHALGCSDNDDTHFLWCPLLRALVVPSQVEGMCQFDMVASLREAGVSLDEHARVSNSKHTTVVSFFLLVFPLEVLGACRVRATMCAVSKANSKRHTE